MTEIIHSRNDSSNAQNFFHHAVTAGTTDLINRWWFVCQFHKNKRDDYGSIGIIINLPLVHCTEGQIVSVSSFKLLGPSINLSADFSWQSHVETVTSKPTKRLYSLKQLKHTGVHVHYCLLSAIRSVWNIQL